MGEENKIAFNQLFFLAFPFNHPVPPLLLISVRRACAYRSQPLHPICISEACACYTHRQRGILNNSLYFPNRFPESERYPDSLSLSLKVHITFDVRTYPPAHHSIWLHSELFTRARRMKRGPTTGAKREGGRKQQCEMDRVVISLDYVKVYFSDI